MDVVSHCALTVAGRVWMPRAGAFALTCVCKATFTMAPGTLALATEQQPVHEFDRPWSEKVKSLYAAGDMAPRKPRADVVLIGNAYAPGRTPVRKLVARLVVGEVQKSIDVWCDRTLRADGTVVEGPPFANLPLLYERAGGGPGTDNPAGMTRDRDAYGAAALPNLTLPGARVSLDGPIPPAGFGPIAAGWPTRAARLGRYAGEVSVDTWHETVLPGDLDMGYFNVAPADQQLTALRGDERIVLENLHVDHPQLVMTLPGLRPRAKVSGPGGERAVSMVCDTLWIDTSREICCLTYRGQVVLNGPAEPGWVVVTLDAHEDEAAARSPRPVSREAATGGVVITSEEPERPVSSRRSAMTMPFLSAPDPSSGLPFQIAGDSVPPPATPPPRSSTGLPFRAQPSSVMAMPSVQGPSPVAPMTAPPGWPAAKRQPPPLPVGSSVPPPPPRMPPPPPSSPMMAAPVLAPALMAPTDSPWSSAGTSHGTAPPPPLPGDFRSGGGALLASNAAAGAGDARSVMPAPAPSRPAATPAPLAIVRSTPARELDAVDLLFFDAASLPRVRRVPAWKPLLAALDDKPLDAEEDDAQAVPEPSVIEDRREILEILVHGEPSDGAALDEALTRGVREDGRFLPPIVLLGGELATPFDEIETLRATVTTVTPLAGNDESLRASLAVARDFLAMPGLSSSPAVADGLTARVREAFNQGKRAVAPGYLDAQTERALVEQRFYQHRKVLGGRRQRALLHVFDGGSSVKATPFVTYLPEAVADRLPVSPRFKVRVVARVHLPLDQYEQGSLALEVLALARLVTPPRR